MVYFGGGYGDKKNNLINILFYYCLLLLLSLNLNSINAAIIPTSIKVNIGMFPPPIPSSQGGGNRPTSSGSGTSGPLPSTSGSSSSGSGTTINKFTVDPVMVKQLVVGNLHQIQQGASMTASVSLIHDHGYYMLVDTPSATDLPAKEQMLRGINAAGIYPGQVQMVLTSHGHPDHTGQGNFFPNSRHFFASYEYTGNNYIKTELYNQDEMKVTQNIELWNTPGHTNQDVSAIVRNTPCGVIAVVGDLFYSQSDAAGNSSDWIKDAWNPEIGDRYRAKVICAANCIVPGHGPVFSVTEEMRNRFNCSNPQTSPPPPTMASTTIPTIPISYTTPPPPMFMTTTIQSPIAEMMTTPPPPTYIVPETMASPSPAIITLPPMPQQTPSPMPYQPTQGGGGYSTIDYPTPPPYVDINNNQIDNSNSFQYDTIASSTITPPITPSPYVTVDYWQQQQQQNNQPQQLNDDFSQPPPYLPTPAQQILPGGISSSEITGIPQTAGLMPVGINFPPPGTMIMQQQQIPFGVACAMPCSVPNGLYSVPAGILHPPPYSQQPQPQPQLQQQQQQLYIQQPQSQVVAQQPVAAVAAAEYLQQHFPSATYPLKQAFSRSGGVILPMVESAATNLVSYLNTAPQMQQQQQQHPQFPQAPPMMQQAGYFELIKRAFHKFTDRKSIGALVVNKGS